MVVQAPVVHGSWACRWLCVFLGSRVISKQLFGSGAAHVVQQVDECQMALCLPNRMAM